MTRYYNSNGTLNAYNICGDEILPDDTYGYKIIAKIWNANSWCAFRGNTDWLDEEVLAKGEQIPFEIAKYLFSTIANNMSHYENY